MKLTRQLCGFGAAIKSMMKLPEKELTIKAPWGNLAAISWGDPKNPPVILCHGKLDVCTGFRPLVSRLPPNFYYLSVDLPGNGRSDHFTKGVRFTVMDFVPTIVTVMKHFGWDKFIYIGHSLGVPIGKFFNMAYPGHITRVVEIDPVPAHHTWPLTREGMHDWYHSYYRMYDEKKFVKFNSGMETAPKYTYEKAQHLMMQTRGLSKEATVHVLERCLEPAGDGLYRFTFDQRMKEMPVLPFSGESLGAIYTTTTTPTFCVVAQKMIDIGMYTAVPFVMDETAWPNGNYKYKIVEGGHDIHIDDPGCMADDISRFILEDLVKAKL